MPGDVLGLVGTVVDNVRIDAIVDEGGFGYVYRGEHLGLGAPVAVKCLKMRTASAHALGSFAGRFRDETKIAYKLSKGSLDIVRSISSGTVTTPSGLEVPYMILEWLEGRTLAVDIAARRNNKRAPLTLDEAVVFLESAALALDHAHSQGVVHRDVKPSNLFVAETREGRRVKVLDFGLAKILDPDGFMMPEALPTGSQVFVCSPPYGAPEQFSREIGAIGPATDVYSFAFVMMELLTGKKARDAATVMEGMLKAIDARFSSPTPRSLGLNVSDAVDRVFAKAVAHKPEDRWENLGAFWSALVTAKRASAILPHVDTQTTIAEDMPAGAREEALRRAADFLASGGSTKGATVGMQPSSTASPDSTMRMPGAPSASAMPIRTLPLDAKIPNVPASVVAPPRVERPREPPRPVVHAKQTPAPPARSWSGVIVTLVLAAVLGIAAYASVRAFMR